MTFTACQNAACSNESFLWWVYYVLEENVLTEKVIFAAYFSY